MLKRKWALKQIFPSLSSKPTQTSAFPEDVDEYPSDSADDDHFDPTTVNRPNIDPRTEAQLRDACAVILKNLKPSGYDIEDTRMKSDVLVDDLSDQDEPPVAALPPAKRQSQNNASGSTWYQEDSDRNSRVPTHRDAHDSTEKRSSATASVAASFNVQRRSDHKRVTDIMQQEQEDTNGDKLKQIESPIAPVPSARRQSRQEVLSPIKNRSSDHWGTSNGRNGSSSTMSTQYTASTNGMPSTSTGVTSTTQTPASTSKRMSDPARVDAVPSSKTIAAPATAGTWMKEEVAKRKQAEFAQSGASTGYQSGATDETVQGVDQFLQAEAVPLVYSRASSMDSRTPRDVDAVASPSQLTLSSNARVVSQEDQINQHAEFAVKPASMSTLPPTASITTGAQHVRKTDSHNSQRDRVDDTMRDTHGTVAAPQSRANNRQSQSTYQSSSSPLLTDFDVTLAAIRARMAATSLSARPVNGMLSEETKLQSPKTQLDFSPRSQTGMHDTDSSIPQHFASKYTVPHIPPIPNKHQFDDSINVQDFWRPPSIRAERQGRVEKNTKVSRPNDIEAVGFDAFMSVVEKTNDGSRRAVPPIVVRNADSTEVEGFQGPNATRHSSSVVPDSPAASPFRISEFPRATTSSIKSPLYSADRPIAPPSPPTIPRIVSPPLPPMPKPLSYSHSTSSSVTSPTSLRSSLAPNSVSQSRHSPDGQQFRHTQPESFNQTSHPTQADAPPPPPQDIATTANGTRTPMSFRSKSVKSPSRLSISSRTPSQFNSISPNLAVNGTPRSALRNLLGKRKGRSSTISSVHPSPHGNSMNGMGFAINGYNHVNGTDYVNGNLVGYQTLEDPEYDDPLVCAAPVVAFGRGF